jgi:hypothetical protein
VADERLDRAPESLLGSGFRAESLDKAISLGARMIGCDAGSTDPGPGPLATVPVAETSGNDAIAALLNRCWKWRISLASWS